MKKARGLALVVLGIAGAGLLVAADSPPAAKPSTQPAKELTLDLGDKVTLKLVLIPPGKFLMGSPETEKDRDNDETRHEVTISKPYYMGIAHVTVDQFAAFVKDSSYITEAEKEGRSRRFVISNGYSHLAETDGASWRKPGIDQKGDHPVIHVSWNDARAFCVWMSKKSGQTVSLPTDAQWEYACRAGTKTAYPWGDNPDDGKGWANNRDQSFKKKWPDAPDYFAYFSWDDGFAATSPVKSFKPNAFGLYDMIGNAWQWCQDFHGNYEDGPATDPTGADTGKDRVQRGGSWLDGPGGCRSAIRLGRDPVERSDILGFRVVAIVAGANSKSASPTPPPPTP